MRSSERGNAVIFILLAVALFAGLAYSFMRGAKSGQGNLTAGQAKIAASEILDYSQAISRAVDKLRRRGCSENELNFVNTVSDGINQINPDAPVDHSCDIFNSAGGNITAKAMNLSWLSHTDYMGFSTKYYVFSGSDIIPGVGTTGTTTGDIETADLYFSVWGLRKEICTALNRQVATQLTDIPYTSDNLLGCDFLGSFTDTACTGGSGANIGFEDNTDLEGVTAACYQMDSSNYPDGFYTFYSVIFSR